MKTIGRDLPTTLPMSRIPVQHNDSRRIRPVSELEAPNPPRRSEPGPPAEPQPPRLPRSRRVPLPRYLTRFLRCVAGLDLAAGTWLLLIGAHRVPCGTRLCEVATLNGRHEAAGLTAVIVALLLAGATLFTSGLTRAEPVTATVLIGLALTGLLAVIGVVLAAALILSVIGMALGAIFGIMVGAIRGDLTR